MKTLLKSILPVVALVAVAANGQAVEYKTLTPNSPNLAVLPTSMVEIIGNTQKSGYRNYATMTFADGASVDFPLDGFAGEFGGAITSPSILGHKFTGVTIFALGANSASTVTLKITPANEINTVSPTSVFVIPENSTGDYDVLLETSSDMGTWSPFLSQTVSAADAKRFFRARIVKKN